jgi:hypothetical protein
MGVGTAMVTSDWVALASLWEAPTTPEGYYLCYFEWKILYNYGPVLSYHGIIAEHWEENHGLSKTILFGHHIS